MMRKFAKKAAFGLAVLLAAGLTAGCHGSKTTESFSVPAEFDMSKSYEITFWAKTIQIKPRWTFTIKPLRISKPFIPILT